MNSHDNKESKPRLTLIASIILFIVLVAVGVAIFCFYKYPKLNHRSSHYGYWVKPQVKFKKLALRNQLGKPLPNKQWQHKWLLFYVAPLPCVEVCQANLQKLDMVYKDSLYARKKPMDIVVGTFSHDKHRKFAQLILYQYPSFIHVNINVRRFKRVFAHVKSRRRALFAGMVYIVNPHGDIVLSYENNATEDDMNAGLAELINKKTTS